MQNLKQSYSRQLLSCDKENIVHLVAYIYTCMLTSNEEISKIEKTYRTFNNTYKFFQSLADKPLCDKCLIFPCKCIHGTFENTCVKCLGFTQWYTNAQPQGCDKNANAATPGLNMSKYPAVYQGAVIGTAEID